MPAASSPRAMDLHLAAVALHDGPAPSQIQVPTLVIHGLEDELAVPANARLLADGIPQATPVLLPGARHVYWIDLPEAHQHVRKFLAEHSLPH